jgi:hypothetical protein
MIFVNVFAPGFVTKTSACCAAVQSTAQMSVLYMSSWSMVPCETSFFVMCVILCVSCVITKSCYSVQSHGFDFELTYISFLTTSVKRIFVPVNVGKYFYKRTKSF